MSNRDQNFGGEDDRMDLDGRLGIAHAPVTPDGNIRASNDEDSVRRRRRRAPGDDVEVSTSDGLDGDPGVTGIDMGGGGSGTDIRRSR